MSNLTFPLISQNVAPTSSTPDDPSAEAIAQEQAAQQPDAASIVRQRILAVQNNDGTLASGAHLPAEAPRDSLPSLPVHPASQVASPQEAAQVTSMLAGGGGGDSIPLTGDNGLLAAQLMLDIGLKTQNTMNQANVAMNLASNQAAIASAQAQIKQIAADKASAWVSLGGSALGAFVPFAAMTKGGPNASAWSPAAGQVVPSAVDAFNKNVGYGDTSFDAQIEQKSDELQKSMTSQLAQNGQGVAKSLDSMVDNALRNANEYFQRIAQTLNNIAANT